MTHSQIRQIVDELAEDVRSFVFQTLDAEIWIHGAEAGRVASAIEHTFRQQIDRLFNFENQNEQGNKRRFGLRQSH